MTDSRLVRKLPLPSPETLREALDYDPETGALSWKHRPPHPGWHTSLNGAPAFEHVGADGYKRGSIGDARLLAHRAAWAIHYGEWPAETIDHLNGDRADNRIANLRDVPHAENQRNLKRNALNSSGHTGVARYQSRLWHAYISVGGKRIHLGYFERLEDAVAARTSAERAHGFHANHGRDHSAFSDSTIIPDHHSKAGKR